MNKKSIIYNVRDAWRGIVFTFKNERNFRIEIIFSVVVIGSLIFLGGGWLDFFIVLVAIFIVLIAEIVNTAIEKLVDMVQPEQHPRAGIIKDISAGFVFVSVIFAVILGIIVFYPLVSFRLFG